MNRLNKLIERQKKLKDEFLLYQRYIITKYVIKTGNSLKSLAKELRISPNSLYRAKAGKLLLSVDKLWKIVEKCNLQPTYPGVSGV
jgi:hypothetical protein